MRWSDCGSAHVDRPGADRDSDGQDKVISPSEDLLFLMQLSISPLRATFEKTAAAR